MDIRRRLSRAIRCLDILDADVAITGIYQGRQRMTLTYPVLNRARRVLWLVTGGDKVPMLRRLLDADPTIPAGHPPRAGIAVGRRGCGWNFSIRLSDTKGRC